MIDEDLHVERAQRRLRGDGQARRPAPVPDDPSWSDERRAVEEEIRVREAALPDDHPDLQMVAIPGGGRATRLAFRMLFEPQKNAPPDPAPMVTKAMPASAPAPRARMWMPSKKAVRELAAEAKVAEKQADSIYERLTALQEGPVEMALGIVSTGFLVLRHAFEERLRSLEAKAETPSRRTMAFRAAFDPGVDYDPGDVVQHRSALWVALTSIPKGANLADNPAWRKIGESR